MEVKKEAIERGYKVWRWDPSCEELLDSTNTWIELPLWVKRAVSWFFVDPGNHKFFAHLTIRLYDGRSLVLTPGEIIVGLPTKNADESAGYALLSMPCPDLIKQPFLYADNERSGEMKKVDTSGLSVKMEDLTVTQLWDCVEALMVLVDVRANKDLYKATGEYKERKRDAWGMAEDVLVRAGLMEVER